MSDSHPLRPMSSASEIDHLHLLSEQLGALVPGEEYSDVTFVVEEKHFPAHRVILAARCQYFRALLYGGLKESRDQAEVRLEETRAEAFSMLLRYLYTGRATLSEAREETLLDFLGLAHRYDLQPLEGSICEFLRTLLSQRNVCLVFDVASLYCLNGLAEACMAYMDRNATEVLKSDGFLTLSKFALLTIVKRDSFAASEREIFQALCRWCHHNGDGPETKEVMSAVRLPLMTLSEMLNVVRPSGLLSPDDLLDAIQTRSESRDMDLNYRGMLIPEENIATMKHGAVVVKGEMKSALLDGDTQNYDLDHGFSRHPIEEEGRASGIQVRLGQPSIINHLRLLLWDKDSRSYSYYIEVSMDELDWVRVVDHSKFLCRSWQHLYFPARVCRFIRVVGTHNTVNKVFHLVALECMYTQRPFTLEKGILVPTENVATVQACASVTEGVSRCRNALLNGDTSHYDWDSGYTCHQLGSGAIVIQLAQPYMLGSMRLLLWDCDERSYSYYVELSTNQQHWVRVVDRTKVACRSWQTLTFDRQPASFIRIVGTHNTANEVFHCVHFECPAQADMVVKEGSPGPDQPKPECSSQNSDSQSLMSQKPSTSPHT
ncbi:BTB/POZ domain-containing protein 9-like [Carassius carassius]|uniref:BTB/POZ domain-containing protein 9-like n=1 Tax=Carassius carassius TaxID=217509 RepID=UPI0028690903|nr:BTB/POZ domain-containing protein 9-like [Carassius carassius]XP_059421743.1 BTB/POZ domain-containing protein 9-like [Carassius carassius]XP_059421744.1 BTB/POZ domain-containing protein 9-like [Carassius carassius]XP_059421745.1 BTB/POZ domain-containing protein 9-like [Carassius carassius]